MAKVQHSCTGCVPIDSKIIDVYIQLLGLKDSTIEAAERAEYAAEHAIGKSPYIGENGDWWEWNDEQGAFIDTMVQAQGSIAVDTHLDPESTNPVQNKVTTQALAGKQATLVSGTNIKTVNGVSLLGAGNIVAGDPNAVKYVSQSLTTSQKEQARSNIGAGTYSKAGTGIPKSDLSTAVQTSLDKADTAIQDISGKQDTIPDLAAIRSGAAAGATAYQKPGTGIPSTDMASAVQTSLGNADSAYQKPSGGIPKTDLASGVKSSLDLADSSVQAEPVGPIIPPVETDQFATKTSVDALEHKVDEIEPLKDLLTPTINIFDKSKIIITDANLGIKSSTSQLVTKSAPYNNVYLGDCLATDTLIARAFWDDSRADLGIAEISIFCTDETIQANANLSSFNALGATYNASNAFTSGATKYYLNIAFTDVAYNTDENIQTIVDKLVVAKQSTRPSEYVPFGTYVEVEETDLSPELQEKINTEYVEENQGVGNAGKFLAVGNDGKVYLVENPGGSGADTTNCVKKEMTKTFHLGADLLAGATYTLGTGWTKTASGFSYDKANGGGNLEFAFDSVANTDYIIVMDFGALSPFGLQVRFGNGVQADPYNGGTHSVVGLIGNGQHLIIAPNVGGSTEFNSTLEITMHTIVADSAPGTDETIDKRTISAGTMVKDLTGFWNICLGAGNTMGKLVSGSRNIAIGEYAMEEFVGGERNIAIGTFALENLVYGTTSIVMGADGGYYVKEMHQTIAIGGSTFGNLAHLNDTTSERNISIGVSSMGAVYGKVEDNVCIGHGAGANGVGNNSANNGGIRQNVIIGTNAGNKTGDENVLIGHRAGYGCTGNKNVIVGCVALNSGAKTATNSIFIGHGASSSLSNTIGSIVIGQGVSATDSHQIRIGDSSHTSVYLAGKKLVFNNDNSVSWE